MNGYRVTANERPHNELDHSFLTDVIAIPGKELISDFEYLQNGLHSDPEMSPDIPCSVTQYGNLSIDERIILEMRSVGIYLEPVPDLTQTVDEEISEDISKLEDVYREQCPMEYQGLSLSSDRKWHVIAHNKHPLGHFPSESTVSSTRRVIFRAIAAGRV